MTVLSWLPVTIHIHPAGYIHFAQFLVNFPNSLSWAQAPLLALTSIVYPVWHHLSSHEARGGCCNSPDRRRPYPEALPLTSCARTGFAAILVLWRRAYHVPQLTCLTLAREPCPMGLLLPGQWMGTVPLFNSVLRTWRVVWAQGWEGNLHTDL